jgi:hypothetical protein
MEYVLSLLLILALCSVLFFAGLRAAGKAQASDGIERPKVNITSQLVPAKEPPSLAPSTPSMSRQEIRRRLGELAKSPPPKDLKMGAMCYEMSAPPDRINYICPKCSSKTLYASVKPDRVGSPNYVDSDIPECRRMAKTIKGLTVELDESEFCKKCSPEVTTPALKLIVKYPGKDGAIVTRGVSSQDLTLLREFLAGKDRHAGDTGVETPLKNYLQRLEQLLGIPAGDINTPSGGDK